MKIKIDDAWSNEVWIDGDKVIKKYTNNKYKEILNERKEPIILKLLNREFEYNDGILISKYLQGEKWDVIESKHECIDSLVDAINEFHNLPTDKIKKVNYEELYQGLLRNYTLDFIKEDDELFDQIIYRGIEVRNKGKQVLTHNDLYSGNILKDGNIIKLIDFEYADISNPIFDCISFIVSNYPSKDIIKYFLSRFEFDESDFIDALLMYELWFLKWSIWKLDEHKEDKYLEMAKEKYRNLSRTLEYKNGNSNLSFIELLDFNN